MLMGVWQLDPMHTQVEFAVKHLGMMTVRGHFADVQASGDIDVKTSRGIVGRGGHTDGEHSHTQRAPQQ
jgi:polyisoprenoid-binding protein YceI